MPPRCVYLHGFASSPASTKARFFHERLSARGVECTVVDMAPDFEHTTISDQLARTVLAVDQRRCVLIGSSMGGFIAALAAAGPARAQVSGLLLLAPAFRLHQRWRERMARAELASWEATGSHMFQHHGNDRMEPLRYGFLTDAARHAPLPEAPQPTLAFAGTSDDLVPVEVVGEFCSGRPGRELVVVDSDHDLVNALEEIWTRSWAWLETIPD